MNKKLAFATDIMTKNPQNKHNLSILHKESDTMKIMASEHFLKCITNT